MSFEIEYKGVNKGLHRFETRVAGYQVWVSFDEQDFKAMLEDRISRGLRDISKDALHHKVVPDKEMLEEFINGTEAGVIKGDFSISINQQPDESQD